MEPTNPTPRYAAPPFAAPPSTGWLHLAASIAPPQRGPFVRADPVREALLSQLIGLAADLQTRLPEVKQATVFRAVLIPPVGRDPHRPARFDVAILVEAESAEDADTARADPAFVAMERALHAASDRVHVMSARCARLLAPVDHTRDALFLFNHFALPADGSDDAIAVWEQLAGWYVAETGLTNSTLLIPSGQSDFVMVNHASWLPTLAARQFSKRSFRTFVRANLRAHHLIAMPVLYRLARTQESSAGRRANERVPAAYGAAKAAIAMLTQQVAAAAGPFGVRANCLAPETILTETLRTRIPAARQQAMAAVHPLRRLGTPEDVAAAAAFLAGDQSSWITGAVLDITGGAAL